MTYTQQTFDDLRALALASDGEVLTAIEIAPDSRVFGDVGHLADALNAVFESGPSGVCFSGDSLACAKRHESAIRGAVSAGLLRLREHPVGLDGGEFWVIETIKQEAT